MPCDRVLKKKTKREREITGESHLNNSRSEVGNGTTLKQPIIFEQTLTAEFIQIPMIFNIYL